MKAISVAYAAALALSACHSGAGRQEDAGPAGPSPATTSPASGGAMVARIRGKPEAPVSIHFEPGDATARVSVVFHEAAVRVEVRASGLDGLTLRGEPLLAAERRVTAGEVASFEVPFSAGPGQSMLAIQVRGAFSAGDRTAVRALLVGTPGAGPRKDRPSGTTQVGGQPARLLPAAEEKR